MPCAGEGPEEDDNGEGMVIWIKEPPAGWNFVKYNAHNDSSMATFVDDAPNVTVAYRQNRCVARSGENLVWRRLVVAALLMCH